MTETVGRRNSKRLSIAGECFQRMPLGSWRILTSWKTLTIAISALLAVKLRAEEGDQEGSRPEVGMGLSDLSRDLKPQTGVLGLSQHTQAIDPREVEEADERRTEGPWVQIQTWSEAEESRELPGKRRTFLLLLKVNPLNSMTQNRTPREKRLVRSGQNLTSETLNWDTQNTLMKRKRKSPGLKVRRMEIK